jgi:macrodomain Ter protein organizer (MatP/YcbG family)
MLTKRVNIMFDQKTWDRLQKVARKEKRGASDLIREAVEVCFLSNSAKKKQKAVQQIKSNRPTVSTSTIDYKGLINEGRRI